MSRKKSGFLTFCCSLLPGAGEMYLGFLKQGASIMTLFLLLFAHFAVLSKCDHIRNERQQFPECNMPPCQIYSITKNSQPLHTSVCQLYQILLINTVSPPWTIRLITFTVPVKSKERKRNILKKLLICRKIPPFKINDQHIIPYRSQFLKQFRIIP